jgi:DNA polymerase I-like protein with 3'-5' exonuclease and polymerase domains
VPEAERDMIVPLVKEEMENAFKLDVPLKVDIGVGKNWADAQVTKGFLVENFSILTRRS